MTRDDVIKLMQQACDPDKEPAFHNGFWTITQLELECFAARVAEAELEASAKVCDARYTGDNNREDMEARRCAAAIRARRNK
jgi:hypothetical protein